MKLFDGKFSAAKHKQNALALSGREEKALDSLAESDSVWSRYPQCFHPKNSYEIHRFQRKIRRWFCVKWNAAEAVGQIRYHLFSLHK